MKNKVIIIFLVTILIIALILLFITQKQTTEDGDNNDAVTFIDETIKHFSFVSDSNLYKNGQPGVKTNGFKNDAKIKMDNKKDVIERAKKEVTIEYNQTIISYDDDALMWRVDFFTEGMLGGSQSVYLSVNGITKLIVYGE